jgi:hypothetical protein
MAKRAQGCKRTTIRFKTKRGKVIQFAGKSGAGCGPRPKPKTGHLRHYKIALGRAARACKGKTRRAFLNCVASGIPR